MLFFRFYKAYNVFKCLPSASIRYFHTIRHLKLKQIIYRLWYLQERQNSIGEPSYQLNNFSLRPRFRSKPKSYKGNSTFAFVGFEVSFTEDIDWAYKDHGLLWLFNLHYFDYINSTTTSSATSLDLIDKWIEYRKTSNQNEFSAYSTSLRIVNWIKFDLKNNAFNKKERDSLFKQCHWLTRSIEYDLSLIHI